MNENDVIPTREEIQSVINEALTKDYVYSYLADFPVDVQEKIKDDLISYPGWEDLVDAD